MSTAATLAQARLVKSEGFSPRKYLLNGILHIGYGFNIDAGISKYAAAALMVAQSNEEEQQIVTQNFWWWQGLDDPRKSVLIEMAFNLGFIGLLHFPVMLAAIGRKDWQNAHDACLNSDAARNPQLKDRYIGLANILRWGGTGTAPPPPLPQSSPVTGTAKASE